MKPDPTILEGFGTPTCKSCATFQTSAAKLLEQGRRYSSSPIEVLSLKPGPDTPAGLPTVEAKLHQFPAAIVDSAGKEVSRVKEKQLLKTFALEWKGGRWLIAGIA